jgi:hypothetical protein
MVFTTLALLQLAILCLPALQRLFATQALSPLQLALVLVASTAAFGAVELEKWILAGSPEGPARHGPNGPPASPPVRAGWSPGRRSYGTGRL